VAVLAAALALGATAGLCDQENGPDRADPVVITRAGLDGFVILSKPWRYHSGDDPRWAQPGLDDSSWPLTRPSLTDPGIVPGGWTGIGWFRRRVMLDPDASTTTVGVHIYQAGASEIYLDGDLVARFGTVSTEPGTERAIAPQELEAVSLRPGVVHVLAVRYSNAAGNVLSGGFRGFELRVGDVRRMIAWGVRHTRVFTGLMSGAIGMFGTFALLHGLLFFSRRGLRENLYFTGFNLALVAVMATEIWMNSRTELSSYRLGFNLEMSCVYLMVLAALLLERRVFGKRLDLPFWIVAAVGAGTMAWLWAQPAWTDKPVIAVFLVLGLADMLRLAAGGLLRREPDAWVVAFGFAALTLSLFGALLRNFGVIDVSPWPLFIGGMGSMVLALSIYLTRRVARTDRELARRMAEVQELTSRALEQERAAREQEIARRVLEADNLRKTAELEEARRLQLAMLPRQLPELPGYDLSVHTATASEVGGDYYDFVRDADGDWIVALGDATGHGLQAGMVVGVAKSLLQSANGVEELGAMLGRIHTGLASLQERRASMSLLLVRVRGRVLRVASAGIPPILIRRRDSSRIEEVLVPGVPLGTLRDARWVEREVVLAAGDAMLLMSDGLAEVPGPDGEPFGYDRVQRAFASSATESPDATLAALVEAADRYRGGAPIRDDVTLLLLRMREVAQQHPLRSGSQGEQGFGARG
jgi:serine phosphatase RsbU (regulator of sigma subunit)